ncbi:MAG TPA: hypothetical protein V6C57_23530 [Coleofasciculaceae cyanobacterium]
MNLSSSDSCVTFVYGVESGILESQTLLAVECLRKFAGRYANSPVLAIIPRIGLPLTRQTLRRFEELGVTCIQRNIRHSQAWYPYLNKALACTLAEEEYAKTDTIAFLDSDTLIIREPELLELSPGIDFAICSTDQNVGSSGPGDKNEPYWLALCEIFSIHIDDLPWVITSLEQKPVRFRLHSGVFSFRRGTGIGRGYLESCEKMLSSRIAYSKNLPFPGDDVALAFAIVLLKLQFKILPISYNYQIIPQSIIYKREEVAGVKILHHHKAAVYPDQCQWLMNELKITRPDIHDWLKERLPLKLRIDGLHRRLIRRLLEEIRTHQRKQVERKCQIYV